MWDFFKKRFIYYFDWKGRYTERRRKNSEENLTFNGSLPKWPSCPELNQFEAGDQQLLSVYPHECRVPKLYSILDCLPRPQAGSLIGSGAADIRTGAHMGSWRT